MGKQTFTASLNYWVKRRGISKTELGRRIEVTPITITRWLNGETMAGTEHLPPLAKALDVSIPEFFSKP